MRECGRFWHSVGHFETCAWGECRCVYERPKVQPRGHVSVEVRPFSGFTVATLIFKYLSWGVGLGRERRRQERGVREESIGVFFERRGVREAKSA